MASIVRVIYYSCAHAYGTSHTTQLIVCASVLKFFLSMKFYINIPLSQVLLI